MDHEALRGNGAGAMEELGKKRGLENAAGVLILLLGIGLFLGVTNTGA